MNAAGGHSFMVSNTIDKGRVCISKKAFAPGDTVLHDSAFVYASELPHRCLACCEEHESLACRRLHPGGDLECPAELLEELDDVADEMCDLDAVNTLDRARCFIQCLLMRRRNPCSLDPLKPLTAANLSRCLEAVSAVRERLPGLVPPGFKDKEAAHVLGALNTNSHELEQVEGSGLFLVACILEHNCDPSCSFTTYGKDIWLTAIRPVAVGERLSIDYGNNFYMNTAERRAQLQETYEDTIGGYVPTLKEPVCPKELVLRFDPALKLLSWSGARRRGGIRFLCSCEACTVLPDLCRAFRCPSQGCTGKVCPRGDGGDEDETRSPDDWPCLSCDHKCGVTEIEVFVQAEQMFMELLDTMDDSLEELNELDRLVAEARFIHPTHFAVFWAVEAMAKCLSGRSTVSKLAGRQAKVAAAASGVAAERAWTRALEAIEEVLPGLHHEKVVFWDGLAQARTVIGDLQGAHEAYKRAYKASVMVSGAETRPTLDIKALVEHQPKSVDELRARYNADKRC